MTDTVSVRILNRTLLQRHLLLSPVSMPVAAAIEHLAGLHAQNPGDPYHAVWLRLAGFEPEELSRMIEERQALRLLMMRGTVHLVTAADCVALRPVLQPVMERMLYRGSPFGRALGDVDIDNLLAYGRSALEERPLSNAELAPLVRERWPDKDANALAQAIRYLLPLVQVPPRGLWGRSGQARHTTAEAWLGRPLAGSLDPAALVLRYLAAFGPASTADVGAWSGLTGLRPVLEGLRPRLRTYRDENGRELFDLPEATLADPDLPARPLFLPEFDNVGLGHADRSRIVTDEARRRIIEGPTRAGLLIGGFAGGGWRLDRDRKSATLLVEYFRPTSKAERQAVEEEGERLLGFLAPGLEWRYAVLE